METTPSTFILGVRFDPLSRGEALEHVSFFLKKSGLHSIFTPNPEMLVDAKRDRYFKDVINSGTLNICDGKGIELFSPKKIQRIPGADFVFDICGEAEKSGSSVYLLGTDSFETLKKAASRLRSNFPNLKIAGMHPGICIEQEERGEKMILSFDLEKHDMMIKSLVEAKPDILFVAFGHCKQEKWIYEYTKEIPSLKIAMGVGGSLDYISGIKQRAPLWMRASGFEWLWRLIKEPRRIRRIWKATVQFPLACWLERLRRN